MARESKKGSRTAEPLETWCLTERDDGDTLWHKVGIAFKNRDGSMNVYLNALPLSGKLCIRKKKVWDTDNEED